MKYFHLSDMLLESTKRYRGRAVMNCHTYDELSFLSQDYQSRFRNMGLLSKQRVALIGKRSLPWVASLLALWRNDNVVIPLSGNIPSLVQRCKPIMLWDADHTLPIFSSSSTTTTTSATTQQPFSGKNTHDPALILFTSGSTKEPKGVVLSHHNILSNLEMMDTIYETDITPHDSSFSMIPWHHCYGLVCELLYMLKKGACVHVPENLNPKKSFLEMKWRAPTLFFSVPKILEGIYKKDAQLFFLHDTMKRWAFFGPRLRMMSVGGSFCHENIFDYVEDRLRVPIYQGYGMTELSPMIALNGKGNNKRGSVGRVLPNVSLRISPQQEILVSGPNLMLGYLDSYSPGFSEKSIPIPLIYPWGEGKDKYFETGDKGNVDGEGFLTITGRKKNEYKLSNGKYVDPVFIESCIQLHPDFQQVLVFPNQEFTYNKAMIYPDPSCPERKNKKWIQENVREILKGRVQEYEVPREILILSEPCTQENGLLTQKMELRREAILRHFGLML